jgi:hypothetical protein
MLEGVVSMNARNQIISKKKWLGKLSGESPHLVWAELLALFRALFKRPCLEYVGDL